MPPRLTRPISGGAWDDSSATNVILQLPGPLRDRYRVNLLLQSGRATGTVMKYVAGEPATATHAATDDSWIPVRPGDLKDFLAGRRWNKIVIAAYQGRTFDPDKNARAYRSVTTLPPGSREIKTKPMESSLTTAKKGDEALRDRMRARTYGSVDPTAHERLPRMTGITDILISDTTASIPATKIDVDVKVPRRIPPTHGLLELEYLFPYWREERLGIAALHAILIHLLHIDGRLYEADLIWNASGENRSLADKHPIDAGKNLVGYYVDKLGGTVVWPLLLEEDAGNQEVTIIAPLTRVVAQLEHGLGGGGGGGPAPPAPPPRPLPPKPRFDPAIHADQDAESLPLDDAEHLALMEEYYADMDSRKDVNKAFFAEATERVKKGHQLKLAAGTPQEVYDDLIKRGFGEEAAEEYVQYLVDPAFTAPKGPPKPPPPPPPPLPKKRPRKGGP